MRKMTFIVSLFVSLMLTPLAMAQGWKSNEVTNRTTRNVYLVFSTWRPATQSLPEGYRITGHYRLKPNQTHEFHAFNNNAFYLQVWHPNLKVIKPTADTRTFSAPVIGDPFEIVLRRQISFAFRTNTILYRQPSGNYPLEDGFLRYGNTGTPINITNAWVSLTVGRGGEETDDPPDPADDMIPPPHPLDEAGEVVLDDDIEIPTTPETPATPGVNIAMRTNSGSTTLNQGSTTQLTISVTENGDPAAGRTLSLSVPGDKATISPTLGTTNSNGQLSATLGINRSATTGTFNVTAEISNTNQSTTLPITIQIAVGQLSISASKSTIEPGRSSTLTITSKTPGGTPFPGVQVSLAAASGTINPTLITTNSSGQATSTYRAPQYTGTPHIRGTIVDPLITAIVVNDPTIKTQIRIPIRYILGSFSVSGVPRTITSGNSKTVTVTVTSKNGTRLSGVRVTIIERDDSEISFSSLSGSTNSSGQWKTTMNTGGKGKAEFTVDVNGLPSRILPNGVNSLTVIPQILSQTVGVRHDAGCRNAGWLARSHTFSFRGTVVSYNITTNGTVSQGSRDWKIRNDWKSGSTVIVKYDLWQDACNGGESWVNISVRARYEKLAGYRPINGAPSVDPQEYEQDLSLVAAHPRMQRPSENALLPNYPNPFNPETWIPYRLAESADVTLSIYSADGKLVRTLALGHQPAGIYENKSRAAYWDGRNAVGERVASGLYFYTLTAADFAATGKMLIMK